MHFLDPLPDLGEVLNNSPKPTSRAETNLISQICQCELNINNDTSIELSADIGEKAKIRVNGLQNLTVKPLINCFRNYLHS